MNKTYMIIGIFSFALFFVGFFFVAFCYGCFFSQVVSSFDYRQEKRFC